MARAYWQIGREIALEELRGRSRADYGAHLMTSLSRQLTKEFGRSFDRSSLSNLRNFYLAFPIFDAVRQELSWTHYRLLSRLRQEKARRFYLNECLRSGLLEQELPPPGEPAAAGGRNPAESEQGRSGKGNGDGS